MHVKGFKFTGRGKEGDFGWMLEQSKYDDALFVFNDNEEQYLEHRNDPKSPSGCARGGGNAVIRPYQCQNPPRAAGIPTGSRGTGYQSLKDPTSESGKNVQALLDESLNNIQDIVSEYNYQWIFYSAEQNGDLGTGIFDVGADIKKYIGEKLRAMESS